MSEHFAFEGMIRNVRFRRQRAQREFDSLPEWAQTWCIILAQTWLNPDPPPFSWRHPLRRVIFLRMRRWASDEHYRVRREWAGKRTYFEKQATANKENGAR